MAEKHQIILLIPVYDDWKSFELLIDQLDKEFAVKSDWGIEILAVDDGSQKSYEESNFSPLKLKKISKISILKLKRNLGHQRAIALGLTYIEANLKCNAVLVMDADGEDTPGEAERLIERCIAEDFTKLVFARRIKRSEGSIFKISYSIYKFFYRMLTGKQFRFGNFSVIPYSFLSRLSVISEGWNHYASAVLKARIPYCEVDTIRGIRLSGESKMNFVSLIIHGLSSISVYGDIVGVRLFITTLIFAAVSISSIAVVIIIRILTLPEHVVIVPGWATYAITILLMILLQSITLSFFFSFITLSRRDTATFLPQRDYHYFIADKYQIYPVKIEN